jgi:hypothetical protein
MLIHAVLAAAISSAALNAQAQAVTAGEARLAPAFGNTVVSIYPDGRTQRIWLHAGGDFEGIGRKGQHIAGHWTVKGEKVCLRQTHPPTLPFSYCTPFPEDPKIGAMWAAKDFFGTPIHLMVMPGPGEPDQRALAAAVSIAAAASAGAR